MTKRPTRIIIDTDPGIDDAMAIFYALASPELDVVGLTTIFGNNTTEVCTANALRLLEIAARADIPVARGADRPLNQEYRGAVDFVHGTDGQGDVFLPPPVGAPIDEDAAHFIIRSVMAAPGEITLVPIGPLTNIALAMLIEPRLATKLAGIVLMGGAAFRGGNASPAAEANILNDPEGADIVFGADCPIVMAGLDVTESIMMTGADLARIATFDNVRARTPRRDPAVLRALLRGTQRHRRHLDPRLDRHHLLARPASVPVGRAPDPRRHRPQRVPGHDAGRTRRQRRGGPVVRPPSGAHPHELRQPRGGRARTRPPLTLTFVWVSTGSSRP